MINSMKKSCLPYPTSTPLTQGKGNETIMADEDIGREGSNTDSRDAIEEKELPETADRIHKPSILERLKQEKAQQNTAEPTVTQKTAKKKHEQEL